MDIEQSSDKQSAHELTEDAVEAVELAASALDELLKKLLQMGLDKDREITIRVGASKIYDGTIGGDGDRPQLTEKQAKTLREAFKPSAQSGSIRILDKENNLLFHSKKGEVLKNDLHLLQKEEVMATESFPVTIREASMESRRLGEDTPIQMEADPRGNYLATKQEDGSYVLTLKEGLKSNEYNISAVNTLFDPVVDIAEGEVLTANTPAILDQDLKLVSKGQFQHRAIAPETQTTAQPVSTDPPSLDDAKNEPAQAIAPEPSSDEPIDVGAVVDAVENAPSSVSEQPKFDSEVTPNTNQEIETPPQKVNDSLDELGQIAISQATQIAELQAQLSEVNGKLDELTEWKNNVTPMKLANERLGNWMNQQRDKVANKVHSLANRIAASATQKFEQVQDQVKEQVDQGIERHGQAMDDLKGQVRDKVGQVRDSIENQLSQAQSRHNQALGQKGQEAADFFMSKFVEPAAQMLVSQMEKVDAVTVAEDGTKSFESAAILWNVKPDGTTSLTRKADGQQITPQTATTGEMEAMKSMVQKVDQKYGISPSQTQTQAPAQTVKKTVQKV